MDRQRNGQLGEKKSLFFILFFLLLLSVPGVTEEPVVLPLLPPNQPLPEGGVVQHPAAVAPPQQKRGELLQPLCKLGPVQRSSSQSARIHRLKQLTENRGGAVTFQACCFIFSGSSVRLYLS